MVEVRETAELLCRLPYHELHAQLARLSVHLWVAIDLLAHSPEEAVAIPRLLTNLKSSLAQCFFKLLLLCC